MAPRITLPGRGAIDLDVELARILNVGLLEVDTDFDQDAVDASAAPRSYIDRGDVRFYDEMVTYQANEYVLFGNRIWFANREVTGVEPGTSAEDWAELTRNNAFLTFTADMGALNADGHQDSVTVAGGIGISTTADEPSETLTIDLDAMIGELTDVDTTTAAPTVGQVLQWQTGRMDTDNNPLPDAWVPVSFSGSGFTSVTDGTTTLISTSARPEIDIQGADAAVSVTLSDGTDSADFEIDVVDATPTQRGLLTSADKMLIDDVREADYNNRELTIDPNRGNRSIDLVNTPDGGTATILDSASLVDLIDLDDIENVVFTGAPAANQVLQYDGEHWGAASLSEIEDHGGREWDMNVSYTTGDVVSLLVSTSHRLYIAVQDSEGERPYNTTTNAVNTTFWQEADILRIRDIANVDITSDPADRSLLIWNSAEEEWVASASVFTEGPGIDISATGEISVDLTEASAYYSFPSTTEVLLQTGDVFTQNGNPYRYVGAVLPGENFSTFRVTADTTIDDAQLDTERFERLGIQPSQYTLPRSPITTLHRGDVIIQGGRPYQFLGIGTNASGDIEPITFVNIASGATLGDTDLATHYLTLDRHTTYTLETAQATMDDPVTVNLNSSGDDDSSFDLIAAGGITLEKAADNSNVTITSETYTAGRGINITNTNAIEFNQSQSNRHHVVPNAAEITIQVNDFITQDGITYRYTGITNTIATGDHDSFTPLILPAGDRISQTDLESAAWLEVNGLEEDDHPIPVWDRTATYAIGDQVLYNQEGDAGHIFSVYVAIAAAGPVAEADVATMNPFARAANEWRTVQGGIVRLSDTEREEDAVGFTQNATLHITGGSGISVNRRQTLFEITAHGTGHSDATDFAPGWRYSFYPLYGEGYQTGIVGSSVGASTIDRVETDSSGRLTWLHNGATLTAGADYGIHLSGTAFTGLFPDYPSPPTEGIIVYGYADVTNPNRFFNVTQLDPAVPDTGTLDTYARVSTGSPRDVSDVVTFFQLEPDHADTSYTPSVWARQQQDGTDTPDAIPGNKLYNLSQDPPSHFSNLDGDGNPIPFATIDRDWLPADLVDAGTFPVTRAAGVESVVVNATGDIVTTLNPIPTDINNLANVNFDATATGEQVIQYDTDANEWINVDLPSMASGRIVFEEVNTTTYDATEFITDVDNPDVTTPIRTAQLNAASGNLLRFNLADTSTLMSTISFASGTFMYNWDEPSPENLQDTVNVTEDPVLTTRHYNLLNVTNSSDAPLFDITPASRDRNGVWLVSYTSGNRPMPSVSTGVTGGDYPATSFTASADAGGVTSTDAELGMGVSWRDASFTNNERVYSGNPTFLESYSGYSWTVRSDFVNVAGVPANADRVQVGNFTFNNGNVTFAFGSNTPTDITGHAFINIAGQGNLIFRSDETLWNRGSLDNDALTVTFTRPAEVTGTEYTATQNRTRGGFPNFRYPLFWFSGTDPDAVPTAANFLGGTQIQAGNRVGAGARDGTQLSQVSWTGSNTISLASSPNIRYVWVAYPTALNAPQSQTSTTVADGSTQRDQNTTSVPIQGTGIMLRGTGAPESAQEIYDWFRLDIPANVTYTLDGIS